MDLGKVFGTDKDLEENGVWVDIGDGAKIKVARISNSRAAKAMQKLQESNKVAEKFNSSAINDEAVIKIISETVLLDWEGMTEDGENVQYSNENAFKMLSKYNDFFTVVTELSGKMETFRKQDIEEDKENIKKS